jgi:hypothetical protein
MMKTLRFILCSFAGVAIAVSLAHAGVQRAEVPVADSPAQGPEDAPVTIIEFLDYQ